MANFPARKPTLPAPPPKAEMLGNVRAPDLAPAVEREEKVIEEQGKRERGRPKRGYATRQLGVRLREDVFDRLQAIAQREGVGLTPLVTRMIAAWERQRLAEAAAIDPRRDGEDDDAYIARVFKL